MKINFNSIDLGLSGGNRVVFELSNRLVELGHNVTINFAGRDIPAWFSPIKAKILHADIGTFSKALNKFGIKNLDVLSEKQKVLLKNMPECDVNIATFWPTAKPTYQSRKGKGFYLVQHFEPLFYDEGSKLYKKALLSYQYPLTKLCVSDWLKEKVGGFFVGNGVNFERFYRDSTIKKIPKSVMISYRTPNWKNSSLAKQVAELLTKDGFVILLSEEKASDNELIRMYNQAQVYVNLSDQEGFGLGMLEAMNCSCTVVSTPCSEYLKHLENCYIVPYGANAESIKNIIVYLLSNQLLMPQLIANSRQTASYYNFSNVVDNFLKIIQGEVS